MKIYESIWKYNYCDTYFHCINSFENFIEIFERRLMLFDYFFYIREIKLYSNETQCFQSKLGRLLIQLSNYHSDTESIFDYLQKLIKNNKTYHSKFIDDNKITYTTNNLTTKSQPHFNDHIAHLIKTKRCILHNSFSKKKTNTN